MQNSKGIERMKVKLDQERERERDGRGGRGSGRNEMDDRIEKELMREIPFSLHFIISFLLF